MPLGTTGEGKGEGDAKEQLRLEDAPAVEAPAR